MSTYNDHLPLENEKKGCSDTDKRAWERPTFRRLAANRAEAGTVIKQMSVITFSRKLLGDILFVQSLGAISFASSLVLDIRRCPNGRIP